MLQTRLKISSVNNLTEARYFSAMGVEWIGFDFNPESSRYVDVETAKEISGWLAGPRFLGEFGNHPVELVNEVSTTLGFEIVQTDMDLDLDHLDPKISSLIHRVKISPDVQKTALEHFLEERNRWTSQFLLDFTSNVYWKDVEESKVLSKDFLKDLCDEYDVLLKFDFTKENVLAIVETLQPLGIDLSGGNELQTGMQAFDEVGEILELLEV